MVKRSARLKVVTFVCPSNKVLYDFDITYVERKRKFAILHVFFGLVLIKLKTESPLLRRCPSGSPVNSPKKPPYKENHPKKSPQLNSC